MSRDRAKMVADALLAGQQYGVFYEPMPTDVFSATRTTRAVAVFTSFPIDATQNLLLWDELVLNRVLPPGTTLYAFFRSAASVSSLVSTAWEGPFLNEEDNHLAPTNGRYAQIMIAMYAIPDANMEAGTPLVEKVILKGLVTGGEKNFFTKAFEIDFVPRHILLTYNGTIPENTLIQFAVSGKDSADLEDYQIIVPNTIGELDSLPELSGKLKVMFRAIGAKEQPFTVDEFAILLGGDGKTEFNR